MSNPEFLREVSAVNDFLTPNFIIIGAESQRAQQLMNSLYSPITKNAPQLMLYMDRTSAEISKYASNAFKATRISFINEFAKLCDHYKGNIEHVQNCVKKTLNQDFLNAGIGYGRSCFPKDIQSLIQQGEQQNIPMHILKAVQQVNTSQPYNYIKKIITH